ncbi:MAG: periplasmic heavy metal sensor [Desulfobacteraceae bacterium]|nr:periplasmic heavy metal sensor [Desulfobacteraceae bacterium]
MKNNGLKFLLVVSLALNASFLTAVAYQYHRQSDYWTSPLGNKIKKGHFLLEKLSLRPGQMAAMKEIADRCRDKIDGKREEIAGKRRELIALLRQENPDRKAIADVVSQINGIQEQIQWMVVTHILDMKARLNKERQKQLLDLIERGMAKGNHA